MADETVTLDNTTEASNHAYVQLTDMAAAKVSELLAGEPEGSVLRLGVRPGGCAGFQYELSFEGEPAEDDIYIPHAVEGGRGVVLVVDPESAELVRGTVIEYIEGLMGAGFKIENPNAQRSCGCGNSFC